MNNSPDEDTKLAVFLRQNRSSAPVGMPELEDRLMSEIDLLPPRKKQDRILHSWRRYMLGGIGIIVTGFAGMTIFQMANPPEPSIAELNQINLDLEAHGWDLIGHPSGAINHENLADLDNEIEDS